MKKKFVSGGHLSSVGSCSGNQPPPAILEMSSPKSVVSCSGTFKAPLPSSAHVGVDLSPGSAPTSRSFAQVVTSMASHVPVDKRTTKDLKPRPTPRGGIPDISPVSKRTRMKMKAKEILSVNVDRSMPSSTLVPLRANSICPLDALLPPPNPVTPHASSTPVAKPHTVSLSSPKDILDFLKFRKASTPIASPGYLAASDASPVLPVGPLRTASPGCDLLPARSSLAPILPMGEKPVIFGSPEQTVPLDLSSGSSSASTTSRAVDKVSSPLLDIAASNSPVGSSSPPPGFSYAANPDACASPSLVASCSASALEPAVVASTPDAVLDSSASSNDSKIDVLGALSDPDGPATQDTVPGSSQTSSAPTIRPVNAASTAIKGVPGFPEFFCRKGNTLHFILPLPEFQTCSEEECDYAFPTSTWEVSKAILIQHLQHVHKIQGPVVKRWCSCCFSSVPAKARSHPCLSQHPQFSSTRRTVQPSQTTSPAHSSSEQADMQPSRDASDNCPTLSLQVSNSSLSEGSVADPRTQSNEGLHTLPHSKKKHRVRRPHIRDTGNFPGTTRRDGTTLHLTFPIVGALRCTEPNCGTSFVGKTWTSVKQSLLRHIEVMHQVQITAVQCWCSFCQSSVPARISSHPCLCDTQLLRPEDAGEKLEFQCRRCTFSCSTKVGIMNHFRSHKKDTIRAQKGKKRHRPPAHDTQSSSNRRSPAPSSQVLPSSNGSSPRSTHSDHTLPGASQADFPSESASSSSSPSSILDPDKPAPTDKFLPVLSEMCNPSSTTDWSMFLETYNELICFAQELVKLPTRNGNSPPTRSSAPSDPVFIQRLYRRNRRRAVRLIANGENKRCNIPAEALASHFFSAVPSIAPEGTFQHPSPAEDPPSIAPFTPGEVWTKLKSAENTAPGPDRLTYEHWRSVDPEAKAISRIFNICLKSKKVPDAWKTSHSIFIPKNDDGSGPEDWRPIALINTLAKLFSRCLASRISCWIEQSSVLSHCQKGFLSYDGAFENNFVLNQRMQEARRRRKELCILSIDFRNAFGSVSHQNLFSALCAAGIGDDYLAIIQDLYEGSSTNILTTNGLSDPVTISSGVRQGCPLSGLLFNIFLDPFLRKIQCSASDHRVLAFADDVLLLAKSPAEMQVLLSIATSVASDMGLSVNPSKCFSLHLGTNPTGCRPTVFTIAGSPVPFLEDGDAASFLGKQVGYGMVKCDGKIEEFCEAGEKILGSFLAPWQRLDAVKTFLYPSFNYAQRVGAFEKTQWRKIDDCLRPLLKDTLNVPPNAASNYLYGNSKHGLMGIPLAAEDSDIAAIDSAFKLLTSNDPIVFDLAWLDLCDLVEARIKRNATIDDIGSFLSGADLFDSSNPISSVWSRARSASSRLGVQWNLNDDCTASLSIDDTAITKRRLVFKSLRNHFRNERSATFANAPSQGKTFPSFSRSKASSHFVRAGNYTRFAEWRFIHRARLGLVPLNAYNRTHPNQSRSCRRCSYESETLPHVLNHCHSKMTLITDRHNAIVSRIKEASSRRWSVYRENQTVAGSSLRPDLILTHKDHALIIDVTVPFENGEDAFDVARSNKISKYKDLANSLKARFKQVTVEAIVVGALGSWDPKNDRVLARICTKKYATLMKKLIVSQTIRFSRDIYTEHLTNIRQRNSYNKRNNSRRQFSSYGNRQPACQDSPEGSNIPDSSND